MKMLEVRQGPDRLPDSDDDILLMRVAVTAHDHGQLDDAAAICRSVLRLSPCNYEALRLLGYVYFAQKMDKKGIALHVKALSIHAEDANLCLSSAYYLYNVGDFVGSLHCFDRALAINQNQAAACAGRAAALDRLRRYDEAVESYDCAIAINPYFAEAHSNRGASLARLNRHEEALVSYDRAIAIDPEYAEAFSNRGAALSQLKRPEEALVSYDRAVAINPFYFDAHRNRGLALARLLRYGEAIASFDCAIAINPGYAEVHSDRGNGLGKLNRHAEALRSYDYAIFLKPDFAAAYSDRGASLAKFRRHVEALTSYDRAIALNPDLTEAYWNKSLSLLALGQYQDGWALYEWRKKANSSPNPSRMDCINLHDMIDKRVLVHWEQGIGDTIQFCRYVSEVAKIASSVTFAVPNQLLRLFSGHFPGVSIFGESDFYGDFDMHCFLMSLPGTFGTTVDKIPAEASYIKASSTESNTMSRRLGARIRPRVGLVWNGGFRPEQPDVSSINERRNMDFSFIAKLNLDGVDFYSLQKGEPAESGLVENLNCFWRGDNFYNLTEEIKDFSDTAALIDNLDIIISVDTSTAHLAAAMGKPVWILNRFDSCWRWLLDRSDSPWYPSVRLFRQSEPGNWGQVIAEVRVELEIFLGLKASNAETK